MGEKPAKTHTRWEIEMNITIIGCGYVGTAVARRWKQSGHVVTVTTTTQERVPELKQVAQRVVVMRGDDADAMHDVVQNQKVILLSVGAKRRDAYKEAYLDTAKNLVTALKQTSNVKQLIYTSTNSVYGDKKGEWVNEDVPVAPTNENGQILCETEQVLSGASSETLNVCILRLAGIYGAGREVVKIFGSYAGTTRPGTGEEFINWIHRDDIVEALELVRLKHLEGIYNLVNDVPLTLREMFDGLSKHHGLATVSWDSSAPQIRQNMRLSNQKIKQAGLQLIYPETLL
jgi:nucleoside-diphosphate-sugar epimerase